MKNKNTIRNRMGIEIGERACGLRPKKEHPMAIIKEEHPRTIAHKGLILLGHTKKRRMPRANPTGIQRKKDRCVSSTAHALPRACLADRE
jgi:hypothetical protein